MTRAIPLLRAVFMRAAFAMLVATGLAGCQMAGTRQDPALYNELGGQAGVQRLVDTLLVRIYADQRIAFLFRDVDRADLNRLIVEQICRETGGPCEYTGREMAEAHSGLGLKHVEFDAFVQDFTDAMEEIGLPYRVQNQVLAIFAPMRPEVVDQ